MFLSDEEHLERIAEALFVERLNLKPEVHTTLSILLENLRWFRAICVKESKSLDEITPEFLIEQFAGRVIQPNELAKVRKEVWEKMKNGSLLRPSPLTPRSSGTRRKRRAP